MGGSKDLSKKLTFASNLTELAYLSLEREYDDENLESRPPAFDRMDTGRRRSRDGGRRGGGSGFR